MIKFTNFKTKALALVAMTALSAGSVFGQNADLPIATSPKILQWDGTNKLQAPVLNGALVQGISTSFTATDWASEFTVNQATTVPTGNPSNSTWWVDGSSLNVFAGEGNKVAVTFDISAKYLKNVKNLEIVLGANRLGGANMDVNFDAEILVYDAAGTLIPFSTIYEGGTDAFGLKSDIYNTADGDEILKFFQPATDLTEDNKFIEGSLDNKLIRVTLTSDLPVGEAGNHFPAALVVKSITINSDAPSITLTPSKKSFEAGLGYQTPWAESGLLTVTSTLADGSIVGLETPGGFVFNGSNPMSVTLPVTGTIQYGFKPTTIDIFTGPFKAAFAATVDPLSPVKNLTVNTESITGNSVPVLNLSEDRLTFTENLISAQEVLIWGKNIPDPTIYGAPTFGAAWATTDQDQSQFSLVGVTNNFTVGALGKIESLPANKIRVNYAEIVNNIDYNPTIYLKINPNYSIASAIKGLTTFTGNETDASIALNPFPQILIVGNVAALWFEYEGTDGTPGQIVGDISTAFYAPYDATLENQAYSRIKTFYLKGAKIQSDNESDFTTFTISLDKLALHDNNGHMAFFYSVDNGATWKTPVTESTIKVAMLTVADQEKFKNEGYPILVKFRPDCDGFEQYSNLRADADPRYIWAPHFNLLKAVQKDRPVVLARAIVFGDTRANLENTIHEWNLVDVMENSLPSSWNSWVLTKSSFRKDYGTKFLSACGEQPNPLTEGSFLVSGYNLTNNVDINIDSDSHNGKAFTYVIEPVAGFGTLDGTSIVPNQYGEVAAKVTVTFAPQVRDSIFSNVTDFVTVAYDGRTIEDGRRSWDAEFNYADYLLGNEDNRFVYPTYEYPEATLTGRIFEPTVNKVSVSDVTTGINVPVTQDITFTAKELDKTRKTVTVSLAEAGTPFSIVSPANGVFPIDQDGNVTGVLKIKFAPTSTSDLCKNTNSLIYAYGTCKDQVVDGSDIAGTTVVGQPTFGDLQPGDIQGDRVDLRITPAVGGANYMVGIGVVKYNKITPSIFMSEVYAKDRVTYVELFNGTGETLNYDIISEDSPNYYMEVYKGTTKVQTIVLGAADAALWTPYGITVKTISYDLLANNDYKIVLKQGQITLDVYEFTGDISHKTRKDDLAVAAYKTSIFNESDWTTVGGWHTSLNALVQTPLYASMLNAEVEAANFKQYFDDVNVEKAQYGFVTGVSVSNLKKGVTYTAYAYTIPACDAVEVSGNAATKKVAASDSYRVTGDAMDGVTFGYFTGIDQVEIAKNIYAANGKIYVVGASEGVTIFNALGMQVKAASIEEAAAGIDVANGIYMVKSGDKTAKVLVNK